MNFVTKNLSKERKPVAFITAAILGVTATHYFLTAEHAVLHNILQRLYYLPIIWAAYRFGEKGGLLVSVLCGLLFLPHIFISWGANPEYQVNQILEIVLFLIIGISAGILFDQKAEGQRLLQSYEKMALFGNLSRSIIRSLKTPIKAAKGMLITLRHLAEGDAALETSVDVIGREIDVIENVRNELISLVERKKLRLKKQYLNEVLFGFTSQIEPILRLKKIQFAKNSARLRLMAYINKKAIVQALHHLVGIMLDQPLSEQKLQMYSGESASSVWLGATVRDTILRSHGLSDLNYIFDSSNHDYNLVSIINIMNNHFGDVRFRWEKGQLIEFILIFPKKLKLPWFLKDEPAAKLRQLFSPAKAKVNNKVSEEVR